MVLFQTGWIFLQKCSHWGLFQLGSCNAVLSVTRSGRLATPYTKGDCAYYGTDPPWVLWHHEALRSANSIKQRLTDWKISLSEVRFVNTQTLYSRAALNLSVLLWFNQTKGSTLFTFAKSDLFFIVTLTLTRPLHNFSLVCWILSCLDPQNCQWLQKVFGFVFDSASDCHHVMEHQ